MDLVLATRNPGKVAELEARLGGLGVALVTAASLGAPEVEEDAETLAGNAEKKARALREHAGRPALADDTGLEVDALGGAPGVHSARYASPDADANANRRRLLADLAGAETRTARFRTVLAYADASGVRTFDGVLRGADRDGGGRDGRVRLRLRVPAPPTATAARSPRCRPRRKNRIKPPGPGAGRPFPGGWQTGPTGGRLRRSASAGP